MVDAYWTMYCNSKSRPFHGGTVVFAAGNVVGHDLAHEFHGTYRVDGNALRVEVAVLHYGEHTEPQGLPHKFNLVLEGKASARRMVLRGRVMGERPRLIRIVCLKRSNIHYTPATAVVKTSVHEHHAEISALNGNVTADTIIRFLDIIASGRSRKQGRFIVDVLAAANQLSPAENYRIWYHATKLDLSGARVAYVLHGRPLTPDATLMEAVTRSRNGEFTGVHDHNEALRWLGLRILRFRTRRRTRYRYCLNGLRVERS